MKENSNTRGRDIYYLLNVLFGYIKFTNDYYDLVSSNEYIFEEFDEKSPMGKMQFIFTSNKKNYDLYALFLSAYIAEKG
jgi:hypothetical protein